MPKLLSNDEVAVYRDRGYHFPVDALSSIYRRARLEGNHKMAFKPLATAISIYGWIGCQAGDVC